jgi:hypothetical protein
MVKVSDIKAHKKLTNVTRVIKHTNKIKQSERSSAGEDGQGA